jgi:hypothetical protein
LRILHLQSPHLHAIKVIIGGGSTMAITGKELERMLGVLTPFSPTHLDHATRAARAAGLFPLGGRGFTAPLLETRQVATFLLGLAATDIPQRLANAAERYAALKPTWSGHGRAPARAKPFQDSATLGDALTALLDGAVDESGLIELVVYRSYPRAIIHCEDRDFFYGLAGKDEIERAGFQPTPSVMAFHYSQGTLAEIAMEMHQDDEPPMRMVRS